MDWVVVSETNRTGRWREWERQVFQGSVARGLHYPILCKVWILGSNPSRNWESARSSQREHFSEIYKMLTPVFPVVFYPFKERFVQANTDWFVQMLALAAESVRKRNFIPRSYQLHYTVLIYANVLVRQWYVSPYSHVMYTDSISTTIVVLHICCFTKCV